MTILQCQQFLPTHVAVPLRLAIESAEPIEAGAALLLAVHRWMRLLFTFYAGHEIEVMPGRFSQLKAALESTGIEIDALDDLLVLAEEFLDPDEICTRPDTKTAELTDKMLHGFVSAVEATEKISLFATSPSLQGRIYEWRGTGGYSIDFGELADEEPSTWMAVGDAAPKRVAHSVMINGIPHPLIQCPSSFDDAEKDLALVCFECPYGGLFNKDMERIAPAFKLNGARALGRLLNRAQLSLQDAGNLATTLRDAGLNEVALELLLISSISHAPKFQPDAVAEFRQLAANTDDAAVIDSWLVEQLEISANKLKQAGDFRAFADVLLAKQQLESGQARAKTLLDIADLYLNDLKEPGSAVLCLLSYLEDYPSDTTAMDRIAQLAFETANPAESAAGLTALASGNRGAIRADLASTAATIWHRLEKPEEEFKALLLLIGVEPDSKGAVEEALAISSGNPEALIKLWKTLKESSKDGGEKVRAAVELSFLLAQQGDQEQAINEWQWILKQDPGQTAVYDALVDSFLEKGEKDKAVELSQNLLLRLIIPETRVHVLRRFARILVDLEESSARTEMVFAEALSLSQNNQEIAERLAKIYADRGEWKAYLAVLGRIAASSPLEQAAQTLMQMADVALEKLDDPLAALGFLTAAAKKEPGNQEPKLRIESLHERLGLWAEVARDLEARSKGEDRVDVLIRLAQVYEERLSLIERTKESLWLALADAPPERINEIAAKLISLHRADGERDKELKAFEHQVKAASDENEAAELLILMAKRALEPPRDSKLALKFLEEALEHNPLHGAAVELASELWLENWQAERVIAAAEFLFSHLAQEPEREANIRRMVGEAAARCDQPEEAVAQLSRVVKLDPSDMMTRARLGRQLSQLGRHEEAIDALKDCYYWSGPEGEALLLAAVNSALEVGRGDLALRCLENFEGERTLQIERLFVKAATLAKDVKKQVSHLKALVELEPQGPTRYTALIRLGDLLKDSLHDPIQAIQYYRQAATQGTGAKAAYHKALDAAVSANEKNAAVGILHSMMEIEPDGHVLASLYHATALLLRELGEKTRARQYFAEAVELNPDLHDAVVELEAALAKEPGELATLYSSLSKHYQLSGQIERLITTLRRLGKLYISLNNPEKAIGVLRQILDKLPNDEEALALLAETIEKTSGREDEALEAHRGVLTVDPAHIDSYRAIRELSLILDDDDLAWCASGALTVLGQATDEERLAFEQKRQPTLRLRRDSLPEDGFVQWILDDDALGGVANIMALLHQPLSNVLPMKRLSDLGLSNENRIDLQSRTLFSNMANAVSRILGLQLPPIYHAPGKAGIAKLPTSTPALAVGDDVLNQWRGRELRFALGRAAVACAPGNELLGISDAKGIRLFIMAALKMVFPDYQVPDDVKGIEEMGKGLAKHMSAAAMQDLKDVLTRFRQSNRPVDVQAFVMAVDRAATRTGLFLANDIQIAAGVLQSDTLFLSEMEYGDHLVEMCAWSVSARYANLRKVMLQPE